MHSSSFRNDIDVFSIPNYDYEKFQTLFGTVQFHQKHIDPIVRRITERGVDFLGVARMKLLLIDANL
jgi:hypothetical protein